MDKLHRKLIMTLPSIIILLLLIVAFSNSTYAKGITEKYKPAPYQDAKLGRNSHVYLPQMDIQHSDREQFVDQVIPYAVEANQKWGVPASAMIGMAIVESGYGTTRIAAFANNIFGIKVWGVNPPNAWQLKGQPNEDFMKPVQVLSDYGEDRLVFDESERRDNWYRTFDSYQEAVYYLAGNTLLKSRYRFALDEYDNRLEQGESMKEASKQYIYNIAEAGYNHLGGTSYRAKVGNIMDQWDLYQYDTANSFADTRGHWAEKTINRLAESGIILGFSDRTFRPEASVTREQFIKMLVAISGNPLVHGKQTFTDVPGTRWSNPYVEAGINSKIIVADDDKHNFEPSKEVSRQEMAVFAARAMNFQPSKIEFSFKDSEGIDNQSGLVGAAVEHGIIVGFEDHTFRPDLSLTRAEAAVVITRLVELLSK